MDAKTAALIALANKWRGGTDQPALKMTVEEYKSVIEGTQSSDDLNYDEMVLYQSAYNRVLEQTKDETAARQAGIGAVRRFRLDMPVKSMKVGRDYLVKGWGMMFASNRVKDTDQEYFPPKGIFLLDYYREAPLWMAHGEDPRYGVEPIGKRVDVIEYEWGLYTVHLLFPDHPMFPVTVSDTREGKNCLSSDSIYHFKIRGKARDGGLYCWPMAGWSLVTYPAEPGLGPVTLVEPEAVS